MRIYNHFCLKNSMNTALSLLNLLTSSFKHVPTLVLLSIAGACLNPACAQTASSAEASSTQWWITPGAVSYHFADRDQYNQTHPGLGLEYHSSNRWAFVGGTYKNSNSLWSKYGGVNWTPEALHFGMAKLGVTVQVVDNYLNARNGKPFAFAAPVIAIEGKHAGVNLYVVPTIRNVDGAVALQFKFGF
jgi:hypothetical protein